MVSERYLIRSYRTPGAGCSQDICSCKEPIFRFIPVQIKATKARARPAEHCARYSCGARPNQNHRCLSSAINMAHHQVAVVGIDLLDAFPRRLFRIEPASRRPGWNSSAELVCTGKECPMAKVSASGGTYGKVYSDNAWKSPVRR